MLIPAVMSMGPFSRSIWGDAAFVEGKGETFVSIFIITMSLNVWSYGVLLMKSGGVEELNDGSETPTLSRCQRLKGFLLKAFLNPPQVSSLLGLLVGLTPLREIFHNDGDSSLSSQAVFGNTLAPAMEQLGNAVLPLVMMNLGGGMAEKYLQGTWKTRIRRWMTCCRKKPSATSTTKSMEMSAKPHSSEGETGKVDQPNPVESAVAVTIAEADDAVSKSIVVNPMGLPSSTDVNLVEASKDSPSTTPRPRR